MLQEMLAPGAGSSPFVALALGGCAAFVALALLFLQQQFFNTAVKREVDRIEKKMSRKHAAEMEQFKSWAEDRTSQVQHALRVAHSCSCADANAEVGSRAPTGGAGTQSPSTPSRDSEHQQSAGTADVTVERPIPPPRSGRSAENRVRFAEAAGFSASSPDLTTTVRAVAAPKLQPRSQSLPSIPEEGGPTPQRSAGQALHAASNPGHTGNVRTQTVWQRPKVSSGSLFYANVVAQRLKAEARERG